MLPRFYVPDLDPAAGEAVLSPDESHHLARVLRLTSGDAVVVFDGRGTAIAAQVVSADRARAVVRLGGSIEAERPPRLALTLVQAVLKNDAMDAVVRDCTMVGVEAIQPVLTERTTIKLAAVSKGVDRWRRVALASAKQCGRARLPAIRAAIDFASWAGLPAAEPRLLLTEPAMRDDATRAMRDVIAGGVPQSATLIVGPEGGWTESERASAVARGCTPVSLGRLTLRAESVPLVACAVLLAMWEG
jgi:16S rRNA (uracil1498-N3)-methyltransferase